MLRNIKYFGKKGGLRRKLIYGGVLIFLVRIMAAFSGLVLTMILARAMGPAEFGVYTFILSVVALLSLPVQMGISTLILRETAQAFVRKDWPLMRGIWLWATGYVMLSGLIAIGIITILVHLLDQWISPSKASGLIQGGFLVVLMAILAVLSSILRGLKHVFWGEFGEGILRPLIQVVLILIIGMSTNKIIESTQALSIYGVTIGLVIIFYFLLFLRLQPELAATTRRFCFKHRQWIAALFPLGLISGLQLLQNNTDLVMLGMLSTDEAVGQYRVAARVGALVVFGLSALNAVISPYIADLHAKEDWAKLQKLVSISAFAGFCLTLPIVIILVSFGRDLLGITFGAGFETAYIPLIIIVAGQVVNAFFGPVGMLLIMSGNDKFVLRGTLMATVANIVLNVILIPAHGMIGAAWATTISIMVWNVYFWFSTRKQLGIDGSIASFLVKRREESW